MLALGPSGDPFGRLVGVLVCLPPVGCVRPCAYGGITHPCVPCPAGRGRAGMGRLGCLRSGACGGPRIGFLEIPPPAPVVGRQTWRGILGVK